VPLLQVLKLYEEYVRDLTTARQSATKATGAGAGAGTKSSTHFRTRAGTAAAAAAAASQHTDEIEIDDDDDDYVVCSNADGEGGNTDDMNTAAADTGTVQQGGVPAAGTAAMQTDDTADADDHSDEQGAADTLVHGE
jgi:hypothetical protein